MDPWHLECFAGLEPLLGFPFEACLHEFDEVWIVDFESIRKGPGERLSYLASSIRDHDGLVVVVEEHFPPCCFGDQGSGRHSHHFHDGSHLVVFIFACEDGLAHEALEDDAPERPHVDGSSVRNTQHDFRSSVESRLDVRVEPFELEATAAVVDELYLRLVLVDEQHVFWLQVAVHDGEGLHVVQCLQDLDGESLRQGHRKALEIVVLNELVQIDTQHFESNTHMTSKSKVFLNSDNIFAVIVVCISECFQYFDLNFTLFMKFFPILQDLDGHMLLFFVIKASEYYTKSTPTQLLLNLISILKLILGFVEEVRLIIIKPMIEWAI